MAGTWEEGAAATLGDLLTDLMYLQDHHFGGNAFGLVHLRVRVASPRVCAVVDGERPIDMVITGLNLVQADPELGDYVELVLEEA